MISGWLFQFHQFHQLLWLTESLFEEGLTDKVIFSLRKMELSSQQETTSFVDVCVKFMRRKGDVEYLRLIEEKMDLVPDDFFTSDCLHELEQIIKRIPSAGDKCWQKRQSHFSGGERGACRSGGRKSGVVIWIIW